MHSQWQEPQFIDDELGGITTSHGPYVLKSAFQPIFSQSRSGQLIIQAFEGLIRPYRQGKPVSPGQFFQSVEDDDALHVDRLCRGLHLRNLLRVNRPNAGLFVNFNPSFYASAADIDYEVSGFASLCAETGVSTRSVVCEITEQGSDESLLSLMVERLRDARFKIAVDDYGAHESDLQRVERLRPDIVKFDAAWVHRFVETPDGKMVLQEMVQTFREKGMASLFEGLEEEKQVNFCEEIGVSFLQGFALARPELTPTSFNVRFPETSPAAQPELSPDADGEAGRHIHLERSAVSRLPEEPSAAAGPKRRNAPFGRRSR
ncbi:EAL domain-containing protein [Pseudohoeflea suaedae]|uniref:EAL domain-containing protein n=1 Tax=Pseudohoeflea suaedae TaxID=877384 RepID=A0A4R5PHF4_9HYPH|nr:EAL domain-containing protein [Pseudohoeflea suaedae]TDH34344.1 EAL domain-containing protein [Pseudohoeflea suaedae]